MLLGRVVGRAAPGPVEAFKEHGVDFVVKDNLKDLVEGMNALTPGAPVSFDVLRNTIMARDEALARDGQVGNEGGRAGDKGGQGNEGGVDATPLPIHGRRHSLNLTLPPLGILALRPEGQR